jgi:hypothetical protein
VTGLRDSFGRARPHASSRLAILWPAAPRRAKVEKSIKAKQEEMATARKQLQEAQQKAQQRLAAAGGAGR